MPLRPRSITSLHASSPSSTTFPLAQNIFPSRRIGDTSHFQHRRTTATFSSIEETSCTSGSSPSVDLGIQPVSVVRQSAGWANRRWAPEIAARRAAAEAGSGTSAPKHETQRSVRTAQNGSHNLQPVLTGGTSAWGEGGSEARRDVEKRYVSMNLANQTGGSRQGGDYLGDEATDLRPMGDKRAGGSSARSDEPEFAIEEEGSVSARKVKGRELEVGIKDEISMSKLSLESGTISPQAYTEESPGPPPTTLLKTSHPNPLVSAQGNYPPVKKPYHPSSPCSDAIPPVIHEMLSRRLYRLVVFHILSDVSLRTNERLLSQIRYWLYHGKQRQVTTLPDPKPSSSSSSPSPFSPAKPLHRTQHREKTPIELAIRLGYTHTGRGKHAEDLHRSKVWEQGKLPSLKEVRAAQGLDRTGGGGGEVVVDVEISQADRGRTDAQDPGAQVHRHPSAHNAQRKGTCSSDRASGCSDETGQVDMQRLRTRAGNQKLASLLVAGPRRASSVLNLASPSSNRASSSDEGTIASSYPSEQAEAPGPTLHHISGTQSHSRQLAQLLHTFNRLRSQGFQPDLVTLNIIVKCFARGMSSSHVERLDGKVSKYHLSPWRRTELGREVGALLMKTLAAERFDHDKAGSLDHVDWAEHVRPLAKMLIKTYKGSGDLEMASKVLKWKAEVKAMCARRNAKKSEGGIGQRGTESG